MQEGCERLDRILGGPNWHSLYVADGTLRLLQASNDDRYLETTFCNQAVIHFCAHFDKILICLTYSLLNANDVLIS